MVTSPDHSPSESVAVSPIFSPVSPTSTLGTPPLEEKTLPLSAHDRQIDNVIFDIGDVLFTWSANTGTSISPRALHSVMRSATWFEYEKGNLDQEEAHRLVAAEFSLDVSELETALRAASDSLQSNHAMIAFLHELKESGIRLFAMTNISAPDWEVLHKKGRPEDWALFERIFTSAEARERKPNFGYFRYVLESTGIDPRRTAFVDDKLENVVPAGSFGLKGTVFTSFDEVTRELRTLVRNPLTDGERYLRDRAKGMEMESVSNTGVILNENFAPMMIHEVMGDPSLVDYVRYPRLSNFFKSEPVLTTGSYPFDLDTTSLACTVSDHFSLEVKHDILDEMLNFRNQDGLFYLYYDRTRPRIDPVININILTFFHSNGRGGDTPEVFNWVHEILKNRAYMDGSLYYINADVFFYFLSRLLLASLDARQRIGSLFAKRVAERFGAEGDAVALAMRIHAAVTVDLCDGRDYERLARMQEVDGSWPKGWMYRIAASNTLIGNKGLTTAFAVSAMRRHKELDLRLRSYD